MIVPCALDGVEERISGKGNSFAVVYVRGVNEDGTASFKQYQYMSFDEEVFKKLKTYERGDVLNLDLEIREATVVGVGESEL